MSIRLSIGQCLILGGIVAGLQVLSVGQNSPSQNPPTQSPSSDDAGARTAPAAALSAPIAGMQGDGDTQDTSSSLPQIPALLGGVGITAAFLSEMERSNYLRAGVNVGTVYDSNALLSSPAESNTSVSIFPNIQLEQSTSRMHYTLGYAGGLTINENLGNQNQQAQNVNFNSQFRLSPHVNLRIAENFSYTAGFFDAGNGIGTVGGSGGPNASLITPLATQLSTFTTVEMNYHFALNDLVGASGSFYDSSFSNIPTGAQALADTQTASGSAFWLHRIVREDWAGITYRFDHITFTPGGGETQVQSFYAVNTLNLSNRFTLTGFIGPQYSNNQGFVPGATESSQSTDWSVAGGVEAGWRNQRTSLTAGYSRTISDGGGVLGTVRVQNVHGNFRREFVPGWAASVTASYGANDSLIVPFATSANSIDLTSAGVQLERNIGKSVGMRLGYTHDFQQQLGVPGSTQTLDASRNRFFFTLSYQWAKPLGM